MHSYGMIQIKLAKVIPRLRKTWENYTYQKKRLRQAGPPDSVMRLIYSTSDFAGYDIDISILNRTPCIFY